MTNHAPEKRAVIWRATGRAEFPYAADVNGQRWEIRVNDFPAEPLYTLLINSVAYADYDEWPTAWKRPG